MHRDVEREGAEKRRQVVGVGRPHQSLGRTADAEPGERRERRVRLHAAAQRREGVEKRMGDDGGLHE